MTLPLLPWRKFPARVLALVLLVAGAAARAADAPNPPGPAIPIDPGGEPYLVTKLRVTDCRAVRGFVGAPVDGSLKSASWDGKVWEYPMPGAGAAVGYTYRNADGLHITFADDEGFNAVVVRGGIKARLLRDVRNYDAPETGQLVCEFPGHVLTSRAWFDSTVKTNNVSFFNVSDGLIADCSFFRVRRGIDALRATAEPVDLDGPAVDDARSVDPQQVIKLVSRPLATETSLAALGVAFDVDRPVECTISITDPLNPRLELHGADYAITKKGLANFVCDFPDQIVPAGTALSVRVRFHQPAKVTGLKLTQYRIPGDRAIVEALEHRTFILHALYVPICEARPWNIWNNPGDDEKYFNRPTTGDTLQDRLRPFVREIVTTLEQCRALDTDGKDPIVRQIHEWMYRKILTKSPGGMPKFETHFDQIDGVPEWAALVHQAWMQAREVPRWWIEHRMTPDGELGGEVNDDTDMYGNYAPFPMLERDGVGGMCLDAAARLGELAERDNLTLGINRNSMDPLHAYEEGMNNESQLAYWNYGDPIYLERCMTAARSTEPLTMVTEKGHRHFRSNSVGIDEVRKPAAPEREHGTHALMWHPTLITAWYNRNPLAMKWLAEWGDGWLAHMPPGGAQGIEVKLPDDITTKSDPEPFAGGWGMTGSAFIFLSDLTGDARFVAPYNEYFTRTGRNTGIHLAELYQMGMLDGGEQTLTRVKGSWGAVLYNLGNTGPWAAPLYATGDKKPMLAAIRKDIEELQRFPYMYTGVECYTDRVFLYPIINPAIAYTGGYTTRNKLNPTYAVSWNGFGTDYAALVTSATAQHLKVLLCNLSDHPLTGQARIWRLEAGEYELTMGSDADNDDAADRIDRKETIHVTKGDEITLTLPSKIVQVLELKQTRKAAPIYGRPDLALSRRELKASGRTVTGVVHNIGSGDVDDVVIALVDRQGKTIESKHLGRLPAPLDLESKTLTFQFDVGGADLHGAAIVVDPDNAVPEIFEGNNRMPVE